MRLKKLKVHTSHLDGSVTFKCVFPMWGLNAITKNRNLCESLCKLWGERWKHKNIPAKMHPTICRGWLGEPIGLSGPLYIDVSLYQDHMSHDELVHHVTMTTNECIAEILDKQKSQITGIQAACKYINAKLKKRRKDKQSRNPLFICKYCGKMDCDREVLYCPSCGKTSEEITQRIVYD